MSPWPEIGGFPSPPVATAHSSTAPPLQPEKGRRKRARKLTVREERDGRREAQTGRESERIGRERETREREEKERKEREVKI